jgi:quinol monooxygenase YgiN
MAEHARVIRMTRYIPAAGKRADLLEALEEVAELVRTVEDCYGVQLCDVSEDPTPLVVISRWHSAEAIGKLPADQVLARVKDLVESAPLTEHYTPL